jgi:glycerol-3-phosphate dehydrogenase (NAD(P)+)
MNSLAVIGAGAWGTALAVQAAHAGQRVTLWLRDPTRVGPDRINPRLPGVVLPETITLTAALPQAAFAVLAVPVQHLRAVLTALPRPGAIVMCAKGIETGRHLLPLEMVAAVLGALPAAVLSGPNFAHEIAARLPAAAVVAATDAALRQAVIGLLGTPAFRLYGSDDPIGVQVGGAAKNVIAIAAGAAIGAGLGENARAALVTRGLAEITRLAVALGGRAGTVAGLSGMGDLMLTCAGASSRNTSLGLALGAGRALDEILAERSSVAEGVATAPALVARAQALNVHMPVCEAVARVVTGQGTVRQEVAGLLSRKLKEEEVLF